MNPRLAKRPQWHGFPVPFFASVRSDGTWDFKIVSEANRVACAKDRLCWVCGEALLTPIVFIGGPVSTARRLYNDGPMHPECADDALAICPFMLGTMDYAESFDISKHPGHPGFASGVDRPAGMTAPETMYRLVTSGFQVALVPHGDQELWFFYANTPKAVTEHPRTAHKETRS